MSVTQERVAVVSDRRDAPLEMDPAAFRAAGHALVDRVADLLASIGERPVAPNTTPSAIRARLGDGRLPESGRDAATLLDEAASLLFENSTFNGHPRFFGYITASAAPIGILAEFLAAGVNPNSSSFRKPRQRLSGNPATQHLLRRWIPGLRRRRPPPEPRHERHGRVTRCR